MSLSIAQFQSFGIEYYFHCYLFWWSNLYRPCAKNEVDSKAQVRNIAATSRIVRSNGCTSRLGWICEVGWAYCQVQQAWVCLWQQRLNKVYNIYCMRTYTSTFIDNGPGMTPVFCCFLYSWSSCFQGTQEVSFVF